MYSESDTIDSSHMNKEEKSFRVDNYKSKLSFIVLHQLSLEHHIPLFHNAGIKDMDQFLTMTETDFKSIGLIDPDDLCLLADCSKALKQHIASLHIEHLIQPTINEESESETEYYDTITSYSSFSSSQKNQNNTSRISSSRSSRNNVDDIITDSVPSDSIKRAIYAFDTYQLSSSPVPMLPMHSIELPFSTIARRKKQFANTRPLSMPIQLPSFATPPPEYSSTCVFGSTLNRCRSMIIPREEEGKEVLPSYTCTVFKMGYVYIKKELDAPNKTSRHRSWRKLYVELWGTILRVYRAAPPKNRSNIDYQNYSRWPFSTPYYYYHKYYYTPIFTISLAGAEANRALDYFKRPNVLRLTTQQGPQLLLRLTSHVEMISWVEHLQAAINISLDLELRPMPKFITIPTRGLNTSVLDSRSIELERLREERRRNQHETLL